jgi:ABC-type multidrug transport system ATPase subunit
LKTYSLHIKNLSKHFGSRDILHNISFSFEKGSLGIAGPNGSGKSTLLKCLAGLLSPNSGDLSWYQNEQLMDDGALKENLGYAAPYINLYDELSCRENLEFLLKLRGSNTITQTATAALKRTVVGELAEQPFGTLSTGQRQRMRLAAALVHDPDVLFLDEPGANLDEKGRKMIERLVAEFREAGKLVIIASNNTEELDLCDRVFSVEKEEFV